MSYCPVYRQTRVSHPFNHHMMWETDTGRLSWILEDLGQPPLQDPGLSSYNLLSHFKVTVNSHVRVPWNTKQDSTYGHGTTMVQSLYVCSTGSPLTNTTSQEDAVCPHRPEHEESAVHLMTLKGAFHHNHPGTVPLRVGALSGYTLNLKSAVNRASAFPTCRHTNSIRQTVKRDHGRKESRLYLVPWVTYVRGLILRVFFSAPTTDPK